GVRTLPGRGTPRATRLGPAGGSTAAGGVRGAAAAVVPASVSPTAKAGPCPASDVASSERPTTLTGAGGGAATGWGGRGARDARTGVTGGVLRGAGAAAAGGAGSG